MHGFATTGGLLASLTKHDLAGLVAIVVGAILLLAGLLRLMGKLAVGAIVPLAGIVLVVIGILLFTRAI